MCVVNQKYLEMDDLQRPELTTTDLGSPKIK